MRVGSLFAGIGGFDLAARWMGWNTVWYSEIDPYANAVMKKNFPLATNYGDIKNIDGHAVEPIDILVGGFPCTDISLAGRGAGIEGENSGLWTQFSRLIAEIRPHWVVIENSPYLRARGLDKVLQALDEIGYSAEWHCIPAAYVGARHQRDRIWIVAYPHEDNCEAERISLFGTERGDATAPARSMASVVADLRGTRSRLEDVAHTTSERLSHGRSTSMGESETLAELERCSGARNGTRTVSDTDCERLEGYARHGEVSGNAEEIGSVGTQSVCGREHAEGWWLSEPNVGRVADGVPSRVDRLRCLGNAVVPQVAYFIFQHIEAARPVRAA